MDDCISRKAAIDICNDELLHTEDYSPIRTWNRILQLPSARPERKKGTWIETSEGTMCGNCHKFPYDDGEYHIANWYSDFCPNCGSRMK